MTLLLVPVAVTVLCWLLSWRRTPFAVGWIGIGVGLSAVGVLIVSAVEGVHHTVPGLVAGELAACFLPVACTLTIEDAAQGAPGTSGRDIALWRQNHGTGRNPGRWVVVTQAQNLDDGKETVWLGIRSGAKTRWIGDADPLEDMDAFLDLKVRADQAAETMNALKVSGGSG